MIIIFFLFIVYNTELRFIGAGRRRDQLIYTEIDKGSYQYHETFNNLSTPGLRSQTYSGRQWPSYATRCSTRKNVKSPYHTEQYVIPIAARPPMDLICYTYSITLLLSCGIERNRFRPICDDGGGQPIRRYFFVLPKSDFSNRLLVFQLGFVNFRFVQIVTNGSFVYSYFTYTCIAYALYYIRKRFYRLFTFLFFFFEVRLADKPRINKPLDVIGFFFFSYCG